MDQQQLAIINLLTKMGDDALIMGHRNSEWTGLGPIMEEDIAFSSMAQDKIGHALALYRLLEEYFEGEGPDRFAFLREESGWKCCHFVEMPNSSYDYSLMRHFLFDHAEAVRYASLENSSFEPVRAIAQKFKGEIKYHLMHADAWLTQLGNGTSESHTRMQQALDDCWADALGMFEEAGELESVLIDAKVYPGESAIKEKWLERIQPIFTQASLVVPRGEQAKAGMGGRFGFHTQHLSILLDEMSSVFKLDPSASW